MSPHARFKNIFKNLKFVDNELSADAPTALGLFGVGFSFGEQGESNGWFKFFFCFLKFQE